MEVTQRVDAVGAWSWTCDGESSRVLSESLSAPLVTSVVNYLYHPDTFDLASVASVINGGPTNCVEYQWSQGRLLQVRHSLGDGGTNVFTYSYLPNSDLISSISDFVGGAQCAATIKTYDNANRLLSVINSNTASASLISRFDYNYDSTGRRIQRTEANSGKFDYGYDLYDQLTSAVKINSSNPAADLACNYQYRYDKVGNLLHEDRGLLNLDGTFNPLNQLTHLGFAGKQDVVGSVTGTNGPFTVKVDGEPAAIFVTNPATGGASFHGGARVRPGTNTISIVSTDASTNRTEKLQHLNFPPSNPQQFIYDLNGNMISDGMRNFTWDDENRLVKVETIDGVPGLDKKKSEYLYDAQSRRIQKRDYFGWTNGAYSVTNTIRFVYDGWLLVCEQSASGGNLSTTFYTWGLDLSQSLQGAGGIGGLLAVSQISNGQISNYFPLADGNGNICDYVDTNGTIVAHGEYDPFGNTVVSTGPMKNDFSFWFSTKYYEPTWNLYYYGYRYYSPGLSRWLSRDPIGEMGFGSLQTPDTKGSILGNEVNSHCHSENIIEKDKTADVVFESDIEARSIDEWKTKKRNTLLREDSKLKPVYHFVMNNPILQVDRMGLDTPGCSVPAFGRLATSCELEGCAMHDYCYDINNCTAYSWINPCASKECNNCNNGVLAYHLACWVFLWRDDTNLPNYYCAACHVFFNDPKSPHMNHSTD